MLNDIDVNIMILYSIILNIGCLVLTGVPGISKEGEKEHEGEQERRQRRRRRRKQEKINEIPKQMMVKTYDLVNRNIDFSFTRNLVSP